MSDSYSDYPDSRYAEDDWGHRLYIFLNDKDLPPFDENYDWEQVGFDESSQRRVWQRRVKQK